MHLVKIKVNLLKLPSELYLYITINQNVYMEVLSKNIFTV